MSKKWTGVLALAGFLVLAGGGYYLGAQMGGGRTGQGQRGTMPRQAGMMAGGAGGGAMIAFERNIYVLMGATLMKIDPATMKVVKELTLRAPMGRGNAPDMPSDMSMGE